MSAATRGLLLRRNLAHHWRAHLAVLLGVVAAGAALVGALLVGDSMRASLRDTALDRLGRIDRVVSAPRFFREALADDLAGASAAVAPVIMLRGGVSHALSKARAERVGILGVDDRFWRLHAGPQPQVAAMPDGGKAVLNRALADELGAKVGDPLILRLGKPQDIAIDTLLGRRDDTTASARVTVTDIIDARGLGAFDLNFRQATARNIYLPLGALQRAVKQPGRINAIVGETGDAQPTSFAGAVAQRLTLADYGLSLRTDEAHDYAAVESGAFLVAPPLEAAARRAAQATDAFIEPVFAYLANEISCGERSVPYSTVAALDPAGSTLREMHNADDAPIRLALGEALLNTWTARELSAKPGDRIKLSYYVTGAFGRLETETAEFTVAGIVPLDGAAADPNFTPPYSGVTDVERIADWDPPFPVELDRVRDQDEAYWEKYKATPKVFIPYLDAKRLWVDANAHHGRCTALRITAPGDETLDELARRYRDALAAELSPSAGGFAVEDVRQAALNAVAGSTDFSGLFIGFSFFLIAAAIMLVALLFRLGVDRRSMEVGLLLATGFAPRRVTRLLLAEGALVAVIGSVLGLIAGTAYARLMLTGLRTWWSAAVNAPFLHFAGTPMSYAIGLIATVAVALPALWWGVRSLRKRSASRLLAGAAEISELDMTRRRRRFAPLLAGAALIVGLALLASTYVTDALSASLAFFGGGSALLVAGIAFAAVLLRDSGETSPPTLPRLRALARLGLRNAPRHRGRSLLIIALIASATFVTTALQAFRLAPDDRIGDPHGGGGGFALIAEASTPLPYDLNTPAGWEDLSLSAETRAALDGVTCMPFRLRPGDSASCLNLYAPAKPRILGAPCALVHHGGFRFSQTRADSSEERDNPWLLLDRELPDGAVPAIGDEASVLWQLHLGLGKQLTVSDESGEARPLEFVALLKGSVLQGEVIVSEEHFKALFPSIAGHAYFLVECPPENAPAVAHHLEADLAPYGLDVVRVRDRLRDLFAVQNTYLSTFQMLGGLGVLLGAVGLIAVLLRNVWERRSELALMQAVGFSRSALALVVLVENAALVLAGLAIGVVAALVAIAPQIAGDPQAIAWGSLLLMVGGVCVLGIGVAAGVLPGVLRAPLLPALRHE